MAEIGPDRPRVVVVLGELVAAGVTEPLGVGLDPQIGSVAARSTIRENPGADSSAPRSETHTNGGGGLSPLMPAKLAYLTATQR